MRYRFLSAFLNEYLVKRSTSSSKPYWRGRRCESKSIGNFLPFLTSTFNPLYTSYAFNLQDRSATLQSSRRYSSRSHSSCRLSISTNLARCRRLRGRGTEDQGCHDFWLPEVLHSSSDSKGEFPISFEFRFRNCVRDREIDFFDIKR